MNNREKETIFITGGLGLIGTSLCKRFLEVGDEVIVYDAFRSYVSPLVDDNYNFYLKQRYDGLEGKVKIIRGDVKDYFQIRDAVTSTKPDRLIHLAALPISDIADKYSHEAVETIYNGTHNILEAIREVKVKRFVLISSSMVYGNFQYKPCDELHPTQPVGVYGATKLGSEILTRTYAQRYHFPFTIVRPSAVYGPTDCNRRVTQIFIENAIKGAPIILHDGGKSELDFTYLEDVADGIFLATKKEEALGETFNVTYGQGRSLRDLAELVKKYFPKTEILAEDISDIERRPSRGTLDISKARKLLGYQPKYPLEKGFEHYIEFVQKVHEKNRT